MLTTVEGVYREGRVELAEKPTELQEGPVLVTFLNARPNKGAGRQLTYGKYQGVAVSTEADFAEAEWRGDSDVDGGS